jgi:hypothetical protein
LHVGEAFEDEQDSLSVGLLEIKSMWPEFTSAEAKETARNHLAKLFERVCDLIKQHHQL